LGRVRQVRIVCTVKHGIHKYRKKPPVNWTLIISIGLPFALLFAVLGIWHRVLQRSHDLTLSRERDAAKQQGTNQALTQHPQIDPYRCLGCGCCVRACPEKGVLALVNGSSCLIHASHCVGHGHCERACPVGALTVGLGDTSQRSDIPILSSDMETSVPGVFIAGELGGMGLIRHAVEQGTHVIETIAKRMGQLNCNSQEDGPIDVLIMGCGPAGIAATLKAHELGLRYAIMDQNDIGGTVRQYPRNKLTLTQPVDLPVYGRMDRTEYTKEELIDLWEGVFKKAGIHIQTQAHWLDLERGDYGVLHVKTSVGTVSCRAMVLALGRRGSPRRLAVPGEDEPHVLYQLTDAGNYLNQDLLVVGGGDSAVEAALALAEQGNRVTLSYRRQAFFRIKAKNRQGIDQLQRAAGISVLFNSVVKQIEVGRALLSIGKHDNDGQTTEKNLRANYVFVLAGAEPPYTLLKKIGVRFGEPHGAKQQG
jgi:thioredoxin reductase